MFLILTVMDGDSVMLSRLLTGWEVGMEFCVSVRRITSSTIRGPGIIIAINCILVGPTRILASRCAYAVFKPSV